MQAQRPRPSPLLGPMRTRSWSNSSTSTASMRCAELLARIVDEELTRPSQCNRNSLPRQAAQLGFQQARAGAVHPAPVRAAALLPPWGAYLALLVVVGWWGGGSGTAAMHSMCGCFVLL